MKGKTRMGLGSTRLVVSTGAGSTRLRVALPKGHHIRELAKKKPRANRG